MKSDSCPYCTHALNFNEFGYLAFETEHSMVIVFREQSHPGRVIVAYKKDHVSEITDLNDEERNAFLKDVSDIAKCMHMIYNPQKVNYGAYSDTLMHLHFHLVPKYKDQFEWCVPFAMNPKLKMADDNECEAIAEKYREAYKKLNK